MKPGDVFSETLRKSVNDWYDYTLLSRLNNKQDGVIIVVMQRLHQDDLVGHLLEPDKWDVLRFPAIAEEDDCMSWRRSSVQFNLIEKREVLDAQRETLETLHGLQKSMGDYAFQSQYQQNPTPEGGAIIKTDWLRWQKQMVLKT